MIRSVLMSALLAAGLAGSATAETITVCAKGCDYISINAAIGAASDGDVIQLSAETYFEGTPIQGEQNVLKILGSIGDDGEPTTVLDGSDSHTVVYGNQSRSSSWIFENLVITNGRGGCVGGISLGGSVRVENCVIQRNRGDCGAGAYSHQSGTEPITPLFLRTKFIDNEDTDVFDRYGVAFYGCNEFQIVTFIECDFIGHAADSVPAIYTETGTSAVITGCRFIGNSSQYDSATISSENSLTVTNSSFDQCCDVPAGSGYFDGGGNTWEGLPYSACTECRADLTCNGRIDSADLGYLLSRWGTSDPQSDIDGDGQVRAADLGLLLGYWGPCD